jgi:glycosyltransferase involved in cell wall biosynthesis
MKIAIQVADLDGMRIDGTRVYLSQVLCRLGKLDVQTAWHLYHRSTFNQELAPPPFPNYTVHTVTSPLYWTQTRFALELWRLRPQKVWMPVQALPFFLPKDIETIVTIHDLAFKYFPNHFTKKDQRRLNWFADFAVRKATKLIAVSESTKRDILRWYPDVEASKIRVIHHGFEVSGANEATSLDTQKNILEKYALGTKKYLLYVGALQPRKNIQVLLAAFALERVKHPEMKLVLVGEKAWLWEDILQSVEQHPFQKDIILVGKVSFAELQQFYAHAKIFVFPSLYEGFGIPILEAQAAGIPVLCSDNSSLPEVGGDAALYFEATDVQALAAQIALLWNDEGLYSSVQRKGFENIKRFSWDKCAKETLAYIQE